MFLNNQNKRSIYLREIKIFEQQESKINRILITANNYTYYTKEYLSNKRLLFIVE